MSSNSSVTRKKMPRLPSKTAPNVSKSVHRPVPTAPVAASTSKKSVQQKPKPKQQKPPQEDYDQEDYDSSDNEQVTPFQSVYSQPTQVVDELSFINQADTTLAPFTPFNNTLPHLDFEDHLSLPPRTPGWDMFPQHNTSMIEPPSEHEPTLLQETIITPAHENDDLVDNLIKQSTEHPVSDDDNNDDDYSSSSDSDNDHNDDNSSAGEDNDASSSSDSEPEPEPQPQQRKSQKRTREPVPPPKKVVQQPKRRGVARKAPVHAKKNPPSQQKQKEQEGSKKGPKRQRLQIHEAVSSQSLPILFDLMHKNPLFEKTIARQFKFLTKQSKQYKKAHNLAPVVLKSPSASADRISASFVPKVLQFLKLSPSQRSILDLQNNALWNADIDDLPKYCPRNFSPFPVPQVPVFVRPLSSPSHTALSDRIYQIAKNNAHPMLYKAKDTDDPSTVGHMLVFTFGDKTPDQPLLAPYMLNITNIDEIVAVSNALPSEHPSTFRHLRELLTEYLQSLKDVLPHGFSEVTLMIANPLIPGRRSVPKVIASEPYTMILSHPPSQRTSSKRDPKLQVGIDCSGFSDHDFDWMNDLSSEEVVNLENDKKEEERRRTCRMDTAYHVLPMFAKQYTFLQSELTSRIGEAYMALWVR